LEKIYSWKKCNLFGSKTAIYLFLGLHKGRPRYCTTEAFSSQKRTSSTSKHENSEFFLLFWVVFALLDPDSDSEYGSGSTDLTRLNPDPVRIRIWICNPG
jgi:hypothetical protein